MNSYQVRIWGELTHDDFWELDLGDPPPETAMVRSAIAMVSRLRRRSCVG